MKKNIPSPSAERTRKMDQLKNRGLEIPLIQGGMGVGVSLSGLAGAVAKTGAMGCISTADCGYREEDFRRFPEEANLRALRKEIQRAKLLSEGKGMIAINAMVATRQWEDAIKVAVEEGIDAVISGAGLPLSLPEIVPEGTALIAPIVSSGRAAKVLLKTWSQKYQRTADFVVLEGPLAGGHLGFKAAEVEEATAKPLEELIPEVLSVLQVFEEEFGRKILLFAAGGIWSRKDIARMQEAAYSLMQMAKVQAKLAQLSNAGLPYIAYLTNPTFGGITASFAMTADIIMAEPGALIGFAGPRVIRETIGRDLPEGFQTSEFLQEKGFVDFIVKRKEIRETISKTVKLLMNK